jgi:hypothetical protein
VTGTFESVGDEKTGEITAYCEAASHAPWEQTFTRHGDGPWLPEPFETLGDDVRKPRRGGGVEYINAAGEVVKVWDVGRVNMPEGKFWSRAEPMLDNLDRARALAGVGADDALPLGRRYQLRCAGCGDVVRRSEVELKTQFDILWERDCFRISLSGLRTIANMS